MLSSLPIILVGLAMDYQMFLVSRVHEMHGKGHPAKEAVRRGFTTSAPVLVAAATIVAVVFAGFDQPDCRRRLDRLRPGDRRDR